MNLELSKYYRKIFREDVCKINFVAFHTRAPLLGSLDNNFIDMDAFFYKNDLIRSLKLMHTEIHKAFFIYSIFITVSSDQTMYTYYQSYYNEFRFLTRYPKFGWCGMGPHIKNPLLIFQYPIEENVIDLEIIRKYSKEAALLFRDEVRFFFTEHLKSVNPIEFIDNFANDRDIVRFSSRNEFLKSFIDEIKIHNSY